MITVYWEVRGEDSLEIDETTGLDEYGNDQAELVNLLLAEGIPDDMKAAELAMILDSFLSGTCADTYIEAEHDGKVILKIMGADA
jgi:hypothetical protein